MTERERERERGSEISGYIYCLYVTKMLHCRIGLNDVVLCSICAWKWAQQWGIKRRSRKNPSKWNGMTVVLLLLLKEETQNEMVAFTTIVVRKISHFYGESFSIYTCVLCIVIENPLCDWLETNRKIQLCPIALTLSLLLAVTHSQIHLSAFDDHISINSPFEKL